MSPWLGSAEAKELALVSWHGVPVVYVWGGEGKEGQREVTKRAVAGILGQHSGDIPAPTLTHIEYVGQRNVF